MKISEILKRNDILSEDDYEDLIFNSICRIPEDADKKSLFFDLFSESSDRTRYIKNLYEISPLAIVTDRPVDFENSTIPIIAVKNARRSYAFAYSKICNIDYNKLIFIGITGTNGKTSTATILKDILESVGIKVGFIGTGKIISNGRLLSTDNYSMTTPDPEILYDAIKRIENDGCEIIIMEVSSHSLALEKTAPIPFYLSIFTGLSSEHMDFHKNMDNYFREKEKLIASSAKAIINCDDKWGKKLYLKYYNKSKSIGLNGPYDYKAVAIKNRGLDGSQYVLKTQKFSSKVTLSLPGRFNIYNATLAFAAASELGITPCDIKSAIKKIQNIDGRMEIIKSDVTVIIDYAHTPFALENLLTTATECIKPDRNIILVFGCGGERDREKRPQMAFVAEKFCSKIIVTNDNPRNEDDNRIIEDICKGFTKNCYGVIKNRSEAIEYAIKTAKFGDLVIISGKGHEKYMLDSEGYRSFNEKSIIENSLKIRESRRLNENKA